jgi:hypothetical protein
LSKFKCYSMWFIASLFVVFMAGCIDHHNSGGQTSSDTTPPTVTFVNPAIDATAVPKNRIITATFSEAVARHLSETKTG